MSRRQKFIRPKCRCCGREWTPPSYVSANNAFCPVCEEFRLASAQSFHKESKSIRGLNGERRLVSS